METIEVRTVGRAVLMIGKVKGPDWSCAPYRFAIVFDGVRRDYTGVPNYCETHRGALARGLHRCRWFNNGTYETHYRPFQVGVKP